jgi:hypothetical protein
VILLVILYFIERELDELIFYLMQS